MIATLYDLAMAGNIPAIRLILEFTDGKPFTREPGSDLPVNIKAYLTISPDDWPDHDDNV